MALGDLRIPLNSGTYDVLGINFLWAGVSPFAIPNTNVTVGGASRHWWYRITQAPSSGILVSKVAVAVVNQSGNVAAGAYRGTTDMSHAAKPGTKLAHSGTVACGAAGEQQLTLDSAVTLFAGDWLMFSADGTTATFSGAQSISNAFLGGLVAFQDVGSLSPPANGAGATIGGANRMIPLLGLP